MPSSSNGNTHLERNLIRCFRPVYVHLFTSGAGSYLKTCTIGFASTLHMDATSMAAYSRQLPICNRLYDAAATCDEIGTLLTNFDRTEEGGLWYDRAVQLCRDAEEVNRRDQMAVLEAHERDRMAMETTEREEVLMGAAREQSIIKESERERRLREEREERVMDVHEQLLMELQRCVKMLPTPLVPHERPMESNKLGKRSMEAEKRGEVPVSPTKRGKRPMKVNELEKSPTDEAVVGTRP